MPSRYFTRAELDTLIDYPSHGWVERTAWTTCVLPRLEDELTLVQRDRFEAELARWRAERAGG